MKRKNKRASGVEDAEHPPTPPAGQSNGGFAAGQQATQQASGPASAPISGPRAAQQPAAPQLLHQAAFQDAPSAQEHSQWQDADAALQNGPVASPQQNLHAHHIDVLSGARRMSVTMADADAATDGVAVSQTAAAAGQQQHQQLQPQHAPLMNGNGNASEHVGMANSRAATAQASEAAGDMRRSRRGDVRALCKPYRCIRLTRHPLSNTLKHISTLKAARCRDKGHNPSGIRLVASDQLLVETPKSASVGSAVVSLTSDLRRS